MNPRQLLNFNLKSTYKKKKKQRSNCKVLGVVKIKGLKEAGH